MPLTFPPLLAEWKGAAQGRAFPGSAHTTKKALEARAAKPLHHMPTKETVNDMLLATGPSHFQLLQKTVQLPDELVRRDTNTPGLHVSRSAQSRSGPRRSNNMPLYEQVWGTDTTPPDFSVFEYCQKKGHAPPPNSIPAPRVTDMKSWFATYGKPSGNAPPGVRTEFTAVSKSVPYGNGTPSSSVKMYRGRVLK